MSNRFMLDRTQREFQWLSTPRMKHLINRTSFMGDGEHIVLNSVIRLLVVLVDLIITQAT